MVAAVITPSVVQEIPVNMNVISGTTERRISELYLEGTKATQADWFLLSDYISDSECAQVIDFWGTAGAVKETATYTQTSTAADAKLVLAASTTGTSRMHVRYYKD